MKSMFSEFFTVYEDFSKIIAKENGYRKLLDNPFRSHFERYIYEEASLLNILDCCDLFLDGMVKNFNSFVAMLKNGVPALRNDHGGHGEGNDATEQPLYMAQYMLNLTASNWLFLHEAWNKYSSSKQDIVS